MELQPKITVIIGPTAAGKTGIGIKEAQKNNGSVISADSRQIYAGFNIGTAKPKEAWQNEPHGILTPDIIETIPHYYLNTYSPTSRIHLNDWQNDAYTIIDHLINKKDPLFIVGGTMLYVDSIVLNYNIPHVPPDNDFRELMEREPTSKLYKKLINKDPDTKKFIEPHNKNRIIRALEVIEKTGKLFSKQRQQKPAKYDFEIIGVFPGWEQLTINITDRIQTMLDDGLITETQYLIDRYGENLPLLKTMNYLQIIHYLNKEYSKEKAIQEMIKVNLRYARRQMSWWKNNKNIKWLS